VLNKIGEFIGFKGFKFNLWKKKGFKFKGIKMQPLEKRKKRDATFGGSCCMKLWSLYPVISYIKHVSVWKKGINVNKI
jgi:hypothetical protein